MGARGIAVMAAIVALLAAVYVFTSRPTPQPAPPRPALWSFEADDLTALAIDLPRLGKGGAWVKGADDNWYMDGPSATKVDVRRWGAGIPQLVSGPRFERLILAGMTPQQVASYGLDRPSMTLTMNLKDGTRITVVAGDATPSGDAYYLRLAGVADVYTVHHTWFEVLERLVLDPPVAPGGG